MSYLGLVSVGIEAVIAGMGIVIAIRKKKPKEYGWLITLTFGIYVIYDFVRMMGLIIPDLLIDGIFLLATISALVAVWKIKETR